MAKIPKTLAARVIAQSDLKAERLIAALRMTLATLLFLGVSFVLSQSQSAGLEMRQFELFSLLVGAICYFTLGAVNFYYATEARLRPWMSWVFNLGEVVLVSVQLYVDVADPATPSLLAFASPVILVAALVICVQVLRFKIELHIFSTVLLLGLCGLIIFHDPQIGTPLSPDTERELQLLYSVPPNVMRLIMLSAMAFLIGAAVYRSKRLIETVARETEIAENRKRFLPTELSDKFIGDGALIIFGLKGDFRQACSDAINMSESLLNAIENWNEGREKQELESIRLAVGIHAGPAVIGAIGDDRRLEFTAVGDTINTAARLEELAKHEDWTVVISDQIAQIAEVNLANFVPQGPVTIKGRLEPVEVLARI